MAGNTTRRPIQHPVDGPSPTRLHDSTPCMMNNTGMMVLQSQEQGHCSMRMKRVVKVSDKHQIDHLK